MDSTTVFDISSDEEGWGETKGAGGDGCDDDYDWLSELLREDEKRETDESDDVVVVSEIVINPKRKSKPSTVTSKKKDLDDDCVVLDGDPDKPVVIQNSTTNDSDDLLIVGETGQVACRDFPHPRHLCFEFPFNSTPHEKCCHLCHCYVCDSLAPCVHWDNGTSGINHCHATDKDTFWKSQRQKFKQGAPIHKIADMSLSMRPPRTIQVPPPTPVQPNSMVQNQISRSATIRACPTPTNVGISNLENQGRGPQPVHFLSKNKFHSRNSTHRSDRRHNVGNIGPQFNNSYKIPRRGGSHGVALAHNRPGYGSSDSNHGTRDSRNPSPALPSNNKNPNRWQDFLAYQTSFQHDNGSNFGNSVLSEPRVTSNPNVGSISVNSVSSLTQGRLQPNPGGNLINSVSSLRASSQMNLASNFGNSVPSQLQVSSQPSICSSFPLTSQLLGYSQQPISPANDSQALQHGDQTQIALGSSFSDSNTSWVSPTGQSNQLPLADDPQVQIPGPLVSTQPISTANDQVFQRGDQTERTLGSRFLDFDTSWVAPPGQSNQPPLADNSQVQIAGSIVYSQPISTANDSQVFQRGDQTESAPGSSLLHFDTSWVSSTGQSDQPSLADNPQVQTAGPLLYSQPISPANDCHVFQRGHQTSGSSFSDSNTSWVAPSGQSNPLPSADIAGPTYHTPQPQISADTIPALLDFQIESWMLGDQNVSEALEVHVPPGLNIYSPEAPPVGEGLFFDF